MALSRRDFATLAAAASLAPIAARAQAHAALIVALGGASAERPAGTAAAFDLAITEGADFIETGLVATQDGALIARDDHELSGSTDIAIRPEFAARRTSKVIDGASIDGWFSEDFTLSEIKTLTCLDPAAKSRRTSGTSVILTFQEVIDFARAASSRQARVIGFCATMRRAAWFASIDLALEPRIADLIRVNGYNWPAAAAIVRSPDADTLKTIGALTRARRAWLTDSDDGPSGDFSTVRSYAEIIGPPAGAVLNLSGSAPSPTPLVASAHTAGLAVHAQARPIGEPYPPKPFRRGDLRAFFAALAAARVDAIATDTPAAASRAR